MQMSSPSHWIMLTIGSYLTHSSSSNKMGRKTQQPVTVMVGWNFFIGPRSKNGHTVVPSGKEACRGKKATVFTPAQLFCLLLFVFGNTPSPLRKWPPRKLGRRYQLWAGVSPPLAANGCPPYPVLPCHAGTPRITAFQTLLQARGMCHTSKVYSVHFCHTDNVVSIFMWCHWLFQHLGKYMKHNQWMGFDALCW